MKDHWKKLEKAVLLSIMGGALFASDAAYAAASEETPDEYTLSEMVVLGERQKNVYAGGYVVRKTAWERLAIRILWTFRSTRFL